MIKINLLPPYVNEIRKMKVVIAIFVVLLVLEAGIVLGVQSGLKKQEEWYAKEKTACDTRMVTLKAYEDKPTTMKTHADAYTPWINTFGDLQPFKEYLDKIAQTFTEAGVKIGGSGSVFQNVTIQQDGKLDASGNIVGAMKFLGYYYRLKDQGFDLTPAVQPYTPYGANMQQKVTLSVKGKVAELPTLPKWPDTGADPKDLYKAAGSGGTAPAGGTTPAPAPAP